MQHKILFVKIWIIYFAIVIAASFAFASSITISSPQSLNGLYSTITATTISNAAFQATLTNAYGSLVTAMSSVGSTVTNAFMYNVLYLQPQATSPTAVLGGCYYGTNNIEYKCTNILTGWVAR